MNQAVERARFELRWALRNLGSRRWRVILVVALLAVAIAANALVFATADSLLFQRVPYPEADRLVTVSGRHPQTGRPAGYFGGAAALDEWRHQPDLFDAVHAYRYSVIFLTGNGVPELVNAVEVTAGLVTMLGVRPGWGRDFEAGDDRRTDTSPVLIAESLARQRFGDPGRAVGQRLETTAEPLLVVGVVPRDFRFPSGTQRIWRVLDPRGERARDFGLTLIARLPPGAPVEQAAAVMAARSSEIAAAIGARTAIVAVPVPLTAGRASDDQRRLLLLLVGAALCLLLIACANVTSLELAGAVARRRTCAVQLSLGASRGALLRGSLIEGAVVVGSATVTAFVLATAGADAVTEYLPRPLATGSPNPIDIDLRAVAYMGAIGALAWVLAGIPPALFVARTPVMEALKLEPQSSAGSRAGTRLRRGLTVAQIAIAVVLLVGAVVYVRSYLALLKVERGFDSSGVVAISLTIPPQLMWSTAYERHLLTERLLESVRRVPGVTAAFAGSPPPSTGDSPNQVERLELDDRPPVDIDIAFPRLWITPEYFRTLRIPLLDGRMLDVTDPPTNILVTQALAERLWPGRSAVGRSFRESQNQAWLRIVGVVGHVRTLQDGVDGPARHYQIYSAQRIPQPAPAPANRRSSEGPEYAFLTITARIDSPDRADDLFAAARSVDPRNILKVEFVDDQYAARFADRLLASRVVGGFGVLAFVISIAGIYGVMVFLVADRTREIGVRIALGASREHIRRMVIGSSLRLVAAGALLGVAGTLAAGRWLQSQLYGVTATDPVTIASVTTAIVVAAVLGTLPSALQAARVDPKVLLR